MNDVAGGAGQAVVVRPAEAPATDGLGEAAASVIRELRRHPAMLAVALGTVAVGVAARRPALVRGGGRMVAAQLVAAVGATARARLLAPREGAETPSHPIADMAAGFAIDWAVRAVSHGKKRS
ncbi:MULTISPECIES: hypothetical protein [Sphingomonas]|jgi:hypothetical protein|uniref:hypothetical protein n=1 Tax=Sphingomonas TaxID=13687 RepID=UPI00193C66C8|nr:MULTISPECIES: hypothetical protein [Sphingomonas]